MDFEFKVRTLNHDDLRDLFSKIRQGEMSVRIPQEYLYMTDSEDIDSMAADVLINGGEIIVVDEYQKEDDVQENEIDQIDYHGVEGVHHTSRGVIKVSCGKDHSCFVAAYRISIEHIINALNKPLVFPFVRDFFIDGYNDVSDAISILQYTVFGEYVYEY